MGEIEVEKGTTARAYRGADGYFLEYDDTGTFAVSADGKRIGWWPGPDPKSSAVELDVLGRVLPLALHATGTLCLHGSAVAIGDAGVAFLAPKGQGKSTLAQALVEAGARLGTDDVVPVDLGASPIMRPGVPAVRLRNDALFQLAPHRRGIDAAAGKTTLEPPRKERILPGPLPLTAVYLLVPRVADGTPPVLRRVALPVMQAAIMLVRESKLGLLLGGAEAPVLLERAVSLAEAVPVYALEFTRGWEHLQRLVGTLFEWHGAVPALPAAHAESS